MNTTEQIVESYFRLCQGAFTYPDLKVLSGNNRQLDLLAYNVRSGAQYHIETSVTHELSWRATWKKLEQKFEGKFFGAPRKRDGPNTDHSRGKNYYPEIKKAYASVGFVTRNVQRLWVTWVVPQEDEFDEQLRLYCRKKRMGGNPIRVISFRDTILPGLLAEVGKSNYDDNVLRTLSLLKQYQDQVQKELQINRKEVFNI